MEDLGEESLIRVLVLAVEVLPGESSAVVSDGHAVRVKHWHYFEDDILPHNVGLFGVAAEPFDEALHHVGSIGLPRVRPPRNDDAALADALLVAELLGLLLEALVDEDEGYLQSSEGAAELAHLQEGFGVRPTGELQEELAQPSVGVRDAVGYLYLVLLVLSIVLK